MKLGIGSYTYMWAIGMPGWNPVKPLDALELLKRAEQFPVKVIQYGPNLPLSSLAHEDLDILLDHAALAGIEIEIGTKGIDHSQLQAQISFAQRIGCTLLRTVPEYEQASGITPKQLEHDLRKIVPDLESSRVRMAVENATIPSAVLADVLDRISCPLLGITLDTVNSLAIPEGTEEVVRNLARHTLCLHIKDFSVTRIWHMMGFNVEGRPAGAGQLDVCKLLHSLSNAGVSPNAILELWPPQQDTLEETIALEERWAEQSVTWLRQHITN